MYIFHHIVSFLILSVSFYILIFNFPHVVESPPEAPERGLSAAMVAQREVSILGETLEDMSLSSNSSLDRNDTSQEYMDDFDNLGKKTL